MFLLNIANHLVTTLTPNLTILTAAEPEPRLDGASVSLGWWTMAVDPESIASWASAIQSLVTAGGILVGGAWAYLRFFRDRTYYPRLEPSVSGSRRPVGDGRDLVVLTVTLRNIGLSPVYLRKKGTLVTVSVFKPLVDEKARRARWDHQLSLRAFHGHAWIEARETIVEDLAAVVPGGLPVRAELIVVRDPSPPQQRRGSRSRRRRRDVPLTWRAATVVVQRPIWRETPPT
jgi:hypothetical protein